jgi:hypothetical protein
MRSVLAVSASLLLGVAFVFVACDNSSVPAAIAVPGADAGADPDATPDFDGATKGGFTANDGATPFQPIADDAGPLVPDNRCCNLTFRLDDTTNDETSARLQGDYIPLNDGGVPLTWSAAGGPSGAGGWQAAACIPVNAYVRYGYFFGQDDSGAPDNRVNPSEPTVADGMGGQLNTFGPVANCADADASTGTTP